MIAILSGLVVFLAWCAWSWRLSCKEMESYNARLTDSYNAEVARAEALLEERDRYFQAYQESDHKLNCLLALSKREFGFLPPTYASRDYPPLLIGPSTAIYPN